MPVLRVTTPTPLSDATTASLAAALTHLTAERLGKRAEVTVVYFESKSPSTWFINAAPATLPTALLEIDITEGTNLTQEKAAFIASAHTLLREQLGATENTTAEQYADASYVVIRENAATDWGYGGVTQAKRRELAARL
ncbi:MAG TPA: 4-oxalocrotonate tautomerase [Casimicrobium sp.]|nr:4-oxalocrotonate tautomerase [Casimicrobium sp.]